MLLYLRSMTRSSMWWLALFVCGNKFSVLLTTGLDILSNTFKLFPYRFTFRTHDTTQHLEAHPRNITPSASVNDPPLHQFFSLVPPLRWYNTHHKCVSIRKIISTPESKLRLKITQCLVSHLRVVDGKK